MSSTNCDNVIAELAEWIVGAYPASKDLVAMVATDGARAESAVKILELHGNMPDLRSAFDKLVDPQAEEGNAVRLSALREALGCLRRGKVKDKVDAFLAARDSRVGFVSTLSNSEGVAA